MQFYHGMRGGNFMTSGCHFVPCGTGLSMAFGVVDDLGCGLGCPSNRPWAVGKVLEEMVLEFELLHVRYAVRIRQVKNLFKIR